jgi:hypothetical protein
MNTAIYILLIINLLVDVVLLRAYAREVRRLCKVCDAYFDTLLKIDPSGKWVEVKDWYANGLLRRATFWGFLTGR